MGQTQAEHVSQHRRVRSFVRREGRLTRGQARTLARLFTRYGLECGDERLDPQALFGPRIPMILDIGFGSGEALAELAARYPQQGYLGIEVYRPGMGQLLRRLELEAIDNVRLVCADAVEIMRHNIADSTLAGIQVFFPDPWPKQRHHKRRLVQPDWVALAACKLIAGGFLRLATDWQDYAEHMLAVVERSARFINTAGPGQFAPGPGDRPATRFERRGRDKGHGVWDLLFVRR
ncbi:tRNA (guanosine(46)-N7)-methyltransferase TrmB [Nitrococcus mobilis]|uniref:tRNA (guanine-N(7)-)-methyltransferase n=1 Tax=Nitrococcus mobilis Nb-231 TaxID=314278 RepID=A4BNQ3_9GAMM|nr:tRNA (guanosine(46)-N7)-methyltransferase TrmB [Nitrococcus mobilis]EAR22852.1 Predicted methyltransferase [Nitrococcus mobilis Nb-231]